MIMDYSECDALIVEIQKNSPYKRRDVERSWITVHEMGDFLGLRKTERYWLVHKGYFQTEFLLGQMRVNIASFEKWYANQIKYKKVTGEEPGKELKEQSYSPREIAEMLGLSDGVVYDLIRQNDIETIVVDFWKRVPKDAFWEWYNSQNRYRTKADKERDADIEASTISMPEMARSLGITRSAVYGLLRSKKFGSIFEVVIVAERKRITRSSFEKFLRSQSKYMLVENQKREEIKNEKNKKLIDHRNQKLLTKSKKQINGNSKYITIQEAALLADVTRSYISGCIAKNAFPYIRVGTQIRIPRADFEYWLSQRGNK